MELKFTHLPYQQEAVTAIIDCFKGQPYKKPFEYTIDPGQRKNSTLLDNLEITGFRNQPLKLTEVQLLGNIQKVQAEQNLPVSLKLAGDKISGINFDVEMETGTGKTYCYIKTIFELNKLYGWSKFIIVVPSVAIREGVYKSFKITTSHFQQMYGKSAQSFIYKSAELNELESFASDAGIKVMIINIQAFNAKGAANRRIYEKLDDFQSRKPIDVIAATRPVIILDEPQKMEGGKTLDGLADFKALMVLRYSATHRTQRHLIHRLDALDAYNQKLVKKIAVRGISVSGLAGTSGYLYLEDIEISKAAPVARLDMEIRFQNGQIKRQIKKVKKGDDLHVLSGELGQYASLVVSEINAVAATVEFTNGLILNCGEAQGDINENTLRRLQIREAIRAHFAKEDSLYPLGIKVLTLFFIDEVVKYRDYTQEDAKGEYARIFEEEYAAAQAEALSCIPFDGQNYRQYLERDEASTVHKGYFSIDKQRRMVDPVEAKKGEEKGQSNNAADYELILKDKERLLSLAEPVRFIFSHSALREGWDNPNVFVMGLLKHSGNTISRRQEVGRGLRLSVNQDGARQDHPATVHDVNVLTVVASESYKDFVENLQSEIHKALSHRPCKADRDFFFNKIIKLETEEITLDKSLAKKICRYLDDNGYVDDDDHITPAYRLARVNGTVAPLPPELGNLGEKLLALIDSVYDESQQQTFDDDRKPKLLPLNDNFKRKEFQELWSRINRKAVYKAKYDSEELIRNCVSVLDNQLKVPLLTYAVEEGIQVQELSSEQLESKEGFTLQATHVKTDSTPAHSQVPYDLIGKLNTATQLTRRTIAAILSRISPKTFANFRLNPEYFITEVGRLITEQKATAIVEKLSYDLTNDFYDQSIFTADKFRLDKALKSPSKHIRDYVPVDSDVERDFVEAVNIGSEVVVYAKLPRGFFIPTPMGDYHPDWAIVFDEAKVRHIYFVAETKGNLSSLELRQIEKGKIECARRFFDKLNQALPTPLNQNPVTYDVIDSYSRLMELVRPGGV